MFTEVVHGKREWCKSFNLGPLQLLYSHKIDQEYVRDFIRGVLVDELGFTQETEDLFILQKGDVQVRIAWEDGNLTFPNHSETHRNIILFNVRSLLDRIRWEWERELARSKDKL